MTLRDEETNLLTGLQLSSFLVSLSGSLAHFRLLSVLLLGDLLLLLGFLAKIDDLYVLFFVAHFSVFLILRTQ